MSTTPTSRTQQWIAKQFPPAERPHLESSPQVRFVNNITIKGNPCGCKIKDFGYHEYGIEYCSTHLQAFALKTQVRNLLTRAATDTDGTTRKDAQLTLELCEASGAQ